MYVVGTRPNFMKVAPVLTEMRRQRPDDRHLLVHTGQHYDEEMSRVFFEELGLPRPDNDLDVGSAAPATQTALVMQGIEALLVAQRPDWLIVAGDVNSTLGAAIAAAKQGVRVAHIEAGLRSFDRSMPEELNRILTDQVSEVLFTHSPEAHENLQGEGVDITKIHAVGNTMIDTLVRLSGAATQRHVVARLGIDNPYLLVTLHRPALVDGPLLVDTLAALEELSESLSVVFPVHPRTKARIDELGLPISNLTLSPPVSYLDFLGLQQQAAAVLTDSGGVQEETTFLGVPCFTLRDNTERPVTVSAGTNTLLGLDPGAVSSIPARLSSTRSAAPSIPGWDGKAGQRAAEVLLRTEGPEKPTGRAR